MTRRPLSLIPSCYNEMPELVGSHLFGEAVDAEERRAIRGEVEHYLCGHVYLPTQDEIKAGCEAIQRGWTATERRQRTASPPVPWSVPIVSGQSVEQSLSGVGSFYNDGG